MRDLLGTRLDGFPWPIEIRDWRGDHYALGGAEPHWTGRTLHIEVRTPGAGDDVLRLDGLRFLERFLAGEVELSGNLYAIPKISRALGLLLRPRHLLAQLGRRLAFQSPRRARVNVRSHYDVDAAALDAYLDGAYRSYSCAMFEDPDRFVVDALVRAGHGADGDFDKDEQQAVREACLAVGIPPAEFDL